MTRSKEDKMKEIIITLVDENDTVIGFEEKLEVHRKGLLHRAFSILIFNKEGEMLLQQRASEKYHSPGLWTNACCGHPNKNENIEVAVRRRLMEEMGFECPLKYSFKFHYSVSFSNDLKENEIDHVFVGYFDGEIKPNPKEVLSYKWQSIVDINEEIDLEGENFTFWFKNIMNELGNNS